MQKLICIITFVLAVISGALAQHVAEGDSITYLRSCRVGKSRQGFSPRRARAFSDNATLYIGNCRQLVVMASFQDQDFLEDQQATYQKWNRIFNEENYTEGEYAGSVHDYFMAQSYGQFNLTFDLVFVQLPDDRYKYRSTNQNDENSQYLVDDIVDALMTRDIDWSIYDWDGDSFVDQMLIVYAGKGMNAGGDSNTIWPHQWWLSQHLNQETEDPRDYRSYRTVEYGGREYYVDMYCCVQEHVNLNTTKSSFGTICHEYSHCFGLPDFYTGSSSILKYWELMDAGNYNGLGFCPCNYSAHERMLMGWLTPVELSTATAVTGISPLDSEPLAYLIRNDGSENEYYIVENRRKQGWDAYLPGNGILVFHVDYDRNLWFSTTEYVNAKKKRYWIIPANNTTVYGSSGWAYPYMKQDVLGNDSVVNDSLTNTSVPMAKLNNPNVDGTLLMSKPITAMSVDADGRGSFMFMDDTPTFVYGLPLDGEQGCDDAPMYDLQGRRLSVLVKGIYIQGNRLKFNKTVAR